jgi:hypothetical protein
MQIYVHGDDIILSRFKGWLEVANPAIPWKCSSSTFPNESNILSAYFDWVHRIPAHDTTRVFSAPGLGSRHKRMREFRLRA